MNEDSPSNRHPDNVPQSNGANALAKLLNQLNVPTLLAVTLFGGGNFLATKSVSEEQRYDILKGIREIHDLHAALNDFESRQKQLLVGQTNVIDSNNLQLQNQGIILNLLRQGQEEWLKHNNLPSPTQ